MRIWIALAVFLMSSTWAHAGKHDYFECVDRDRVVSYSITKCMKDEKQTVIRSDEAPGESVTAYVPPPPSAKPAVTPGQSGKTDASAAKPGTPPQPPAQPATPPPAPPKP